MTKVSIIIPFFNASKTILSTLKSVKGQTFGDFECILIDDGSTDSSYLIVKKYISTLETTKYYSVFPIFIILFIIFSILLYLGLFN